MVILSAEEKLQKIKEIIDGFLNDEDAESLFHRLERVNTFINSSCEKNINTTHESNLSSKNNEDNFPYLTRR